ncbi:X-Pro dipeptidase [Acrocarpospora corrugata]|uniref:X-Pro dipeptidase n=1 Tax=Acrocarpospora corrugata TaxID=35763 RepID=A0A5M3VQR7_9ACTN|nr:aminopeptidase P family protein [Acrocarpospora corrugata]GER98995.1 X-Pro dipeptidase [Acrocarpospora corrugata]
MTYVERRLRLASSLDLPALLVTRAVNVRYLTGLSSSNAALLVRQDGTAALATDSRYVQTARDLPGLDVIEARDAAAALLAPGVAVEGHDMTVAEYRRLGGDLPVVTGKVEKLRTVKDETEIDALRRACALTDEAFAQIVGRIVPGRTEREIARMLESQMVELGADKPAFDTIVAAGPNGAIPHHTPGDRPVERGDLITMDFGALYRGYHADMTRTIALGEPAAWQREVYELVSSAQRAGREAVRAGATAHDIDAAARDLIGQAGHAEHFGHGLGHGVGLEIHELPFLGPDRTGRLKDRVPITVEPGVYLPGRGGVRIEDTLVTRADGPELLTLSTKELLVR